MRERLGRYELVEEIGRGGMGVVYRAVDEMIGRTVAIKTILFEGAGAQELELRQRLVREVKAAGVLQHRNIITIHDIGVEDDIAFIVMEYVEGHSLEDRIDAGPIPVDEALRILRETARALDYAHGKGVIHRDIKPGNVLLGPDGQVKIVDFGIAKVAGSRTITQAGGWVGTPEYMAPEALRGEPLSGASDQFSLAVLAYELLTGMSPFEKETTAAVITAVLMTEPAAPSTLKGGLPGRIDAALSRGLSKEGAKRYPKLRGVLRCARPGDAARSTGDDAGPTYAAAGRRRGDKTCCLGRRSGGPPSGRHRRLAPSRHPEAAGRPSAENGTSGPACHPPGGFLYEERRAETAAGCPSAEDGTSD